jgi:DNA-binding response OmpR family regulator
VKIIVIEDEQALRKEILSFLEERGYLCEEAATYMEGADKLALYGYDVVILDIGLPGGSGLTLLKELKQHHPDAAVLIISARDALDDKISGLDLGADDYLVKPFHLAELNARLHALIRRRHFHGKEIITTGEITIEPDAKTVTVKDKLVGLTKKEFELLLYFMVNKNRVLNKQSIAEHLWGDDYDMADSYDFVYVHINNLRKKLHQAGAKDHFQTLYGLGYKFISS